VVIDGEPRPALGPIGHPLQGRANRTTGDTLISSIAEMDIEEAAKQAAGNWGKFECFAWHRAWDIEDADSFAIVYTKNRDSGLLDQSNHAAISKALEPFTDGDDPDMIE
jgi:hypothetical protein